MTTPVPPLGGAGPTGIPRVRIQEPAAPPVPASDSPPPKPELTGRQVATAVFGSRREDDLIAWRSETPGSDARWVMRAPQGHLVLSDGEGLLRMEPDGTVAWRQPRERWTHTRPAPTPDGGAVWSPGGQGLVAYDSAGRVKWRWGEGLQTQTIQAAVGPDGTCYVCVREGGEGPPWQFAAVGSDGSTRWKAPLAMHASSPPAVHPDGKVSVRVDDHDDLRVVTFAADGTKLYEASVPGRVGGRLAAGLDGSVWVGNSYGEVFRVSPLGKTEKVFQGVGEIRGAPRLEEDGGFVFATMHGMVHAVNPDGTEKWHARLGGILTATPAALPDGTLLVGSFDRKVFGLTPEGRVKWEVATGFPVEEEIPVSPDGTAYLSGRNQVVALREGGVRADLQKPPEEPEASEIAFDGDEWIMVGDVKLPVQPRM